MTTELKAKLQQLTDLANEAGARGIWLIRGAIYTNVSYADRSAAEELATVVDTPMLELLLEQKLISLDLHDADLIIVMRFPNGDGGQPGVESR